MQITKLINQVKANGHALWEAGPAAPDAVRSIEKVIRMTLPPSYASFLLLHGAITIYDNVVSGVINGDNVADERGTVLGDTDTLRSEGGLPVGLLVVGPHEDGGYCLDLKHRRSDGECRIVNYEMGSVQHEKPVADTFEEWIVEFFLKPWCVDRE